MVSHSKPPLLIFTEGDSVTAARDQPVRHGRHSGGALRAAGDWGSKLWNVIWYFHSVSVCLACSVIFILYPFLACTLIIWLWLWLHWLCFFPWCSTDLPILTTQHPLFCSFLENTETRNKGYGSPCPANGQSPCSGSQSPIVPPSGASTGSSSPGTPQQPPIAAQVPSLQSLSPSPSPPPPALPAGMVSPTTEPQSPTLTQARSPDHLGPSPSPPCPGTASSETWPHLTSLWLRPCPRSPCSHAR